MEEITDNLEEEKKKEELLTEVPEPKKKKAKKKAEIREIIEGEAGQTVLVEEKKSLTDEELKKLKKEYSIPTLKARGLI